MISVDHVRYDGYLIGKLAKEIEDGRYWSRLPILADALEDAGCTDERIDALRKWETKEGDTVPSERITVILLVLSEIHEIYEQEIIDKGLLELPRMTTISILGG